MELFTTLEDNQLNSLYPGRFELLELWDDYDALFFIIIHSIEYYF